LAWLKAILSTGLLGLLIKTYDISDTTDRLMDIKLWWLTVAGFVFFVLVILATVGWQVILRSLGVAIKFNPAIAITAIGLFLIRCCCQILAAMRWAFGAFINSVPIWGMPWGAFCWTG
jgi:uncharacterized membrane protein YbhN (UPF0104 family)